MPFAAGENVGPYRIIEQLGQGGMATVYKAYHPALDRYVAIKVLHPAFTQDPNFLGRFQREARVVAKLEHPNIVPVYDFAEHEGRPYLVMKFIEGETLKARLARGPLSKEEVLRVVESVGAALAYAHEKGILHRDVKPSNVILANDGRIYLADFGLARIAQAGESTLSTDMLMGTPQYISPEQALGKPDLDEGTDIYSFGVVLYELVVGRVPYSADTPYSIIHDHIYAPLPLPRQLNPQVSEAVERVLLKALAKDRADRYPDVNSLVQAFCKAYQAEGAAAPAPMEAPPSPETLIVETEEEAPRAETRLAAPSATQRQVAEDTQRQATPKAEQKRRWRWWYLLPIGLVCAFGALILFAASDQAENGRPAGAPTRVLRATLPPTAPSPSAGNLDEALQNLDQHPDDPSAYLRVMEAYLAQGNFREAVRVFEAGSEKADDPYFFVDAGDIFLQYRRSVEASLAYLRAMQSLGEAAPKTVVNRLHQSVYMAAALPSYPREIPFDQLAEVDLALAGVAKARHLLYADDLTGASELLDAVRQREPNMPEVHLLDAEIQIKKGANDEARSRLRDLIAAPDAPLWIKKEAQRLLNQIGS